MWTYSICEYGGVKLCDDKGHFMGCVPRKSASTDENIIMSVRYITDLMTGKIDNKTSEVQLVEFLKVASKALVELTTKLGQTGKPLDNDENIIFMPYED